jgi:hypothetical protein
MCDRVNVKDPAFGAIGDRVTDDTAAVALARHAASATRLPLYFPTGDYKITGDLVVDWDDAAVVSDSTAARLDFTDGGLVLDGSRTWLFRTTLENLTINRGGSVGPAWYIKGGGPTTGPTRSVYTNIHVESSTGDALRAAGAYTHTFVGCYLRGAAGNGFTLINDPVAGTVFGNLLTFIGGEIQGNAKALEMTSSQTVSFIGMGIEGNAQGAELLSGCRNTHFKNCYVEGNGTGPGDYDLKVGTNGSCSGLVIRGGIWNDGVGKGRSILLVRSQNTDICATQFNGFGTNSPIQVSEPGGGAVTGQALNNLSTNGTAPIVALGTCTTLQTRDIKVSATLDFPSIAAGASTSLTVTVPGVAAGDDVWVCPNGTPTAGVLYTPWVSATDTVKVRATNITATAIDPAPTTLRVHVRN